MRNTRTTPAAGVTLAGGSTGPQDTFPGRKGAGTCQALPGAMPQAGVYCTCQQTTPARHCAPMNPLPHPSKRHSLQLRSIRDCSHVPALTGTETAHKSPKQNQLERLHPLGMPGFGSTRVGSVAAGDGAGKELGYEAFIPCSGINSVTSLPLFSPL